MNSFFRKCCLLFGILVFQLTSFASAQQSSTADGNLESPFSYGLKGIENINVSAQPNSFLFNLDIEPTWIKEKAELILQTNSINITDTDQMDASLIVEVNGAPLSTKNKVVAYSYSVTVSLAQDVYLARKKKQFLTGARTWTKTNTSYVLKQNLKRGLSNSINDLVEQFITSYYKAN